MRNYFIVLMQLIGFWGIGQTQSKFPIECSGYLVNLSVEYNANEDLFPLGIGFFTIEKGSNKQTIVLPGSGDTLTFHYTYNKMGRYGHMDASNKDSLIYFYGDFSVDSNSSIFEWQIENEANPGTFITKSAPCYYMKKEGNWYYYYDYFKNGSQVYERKVSWKNGLHDGLYENKVNGEITMTGQYSKGNMIGDWMRFDENRCKELTNYSLDGKNVYVKTYYKDTDVVIKETYATNYYRSSATKLAYDSTSYHTKTYYRSGKLKSEKKELYVFVKDTSILQSFSYWSESGVLLVQATKQKQNFLVKQWYENGTLKSVEEYCHLFALVGLPVSGIPCGKATYWDEKGNPIKGK